MIDSRMLAKLLSDEEQLLVRRAGELSARAEDAPAFTSFLTPRERFILTGLALHGRPLDAEYGVRFFWGGFPGAERTILCMLPEWYVYQIEDGVFTEEKLAAACSEALAGQIVPLRIRTSGYVKLSHRDYLGSLLGLGLDRSVIGDILPDDEGAVVFMTPKAAAFVKDTLISVGRDKVKATDASLPEGFVFERSFETVTGTVSAARLDAVVSELGRVSRETAKELIRQGFVEQNYFTAADADDEVNAGDVISVRRELKCRGGKFIIDSLDERSAKGRLRLAARRYL